MQYKTDALKEHMNVETMKQQRPEIIKFWNNSFVKIV